MPERSETPENHDGAGNGDGRDRKGRWKPGVSGNPGGGPGGYKTLTSILRGILREPDPNDPTMSRGDRLMRIAYVHAAKGNFSFFQEILNRYDGKVPDKVEAVLSDGWEMEYGDAEQEEEQQADDA